MKAKYSKDVDILTITLEEEELEYGEQVDNVIFHFDNNGTPIELEILDAKSFVNKLTEIIKEKEPLEAK